MRRIRTWGLVAAVSAMSAGPAAAEFDEAIVVWVDESSTIHEAFTEEHLPKLRAVADDLDVEFRVVDVANGAPDVVTTTPLVTFVNAAGRSIYQGRYTTLDRVRTFVRTMRFVPQGAEPLVRTDVLATRYGRATIAVPTKVADVTGTPPAGHDDDAFRDEVVEAMSGAFRRLGIEPSVDLGRSDRLFYFDVYPWLSDRGELYLSTAIFSHFHCKEPVFDTFDEPARGPWSDRRTIVRDAAVVLERALERHLDAVESGDAFSPVDRRVPTVSWDDLGLVARAGTSEPVTIDVDVIDETTRWTWVPSPDGFPPPIQFRFPPPIDNWVGEAPVIAGSVELVSGARLDGARGDLIVDPTGVTMGEPDLDDALQGSTYLDTSRHPRASFTLEHVTSTDTLRPGRELLAEATGRFELKGVSIPVTLPMAVDVIAVGPDEPRLTATGRLTIELEDTFGIARAEGPAPANNTLHIDFFLLFAPGDASGL